MFIYLKGILITHLIKSSSDQCLNACKDEELCSYFSYNSDNGFCLLFQTCPLLDETDTDYVSGNVVCDYNDLICKSILVSFINTSNTSKSPQFLIADDKVVVIAGYSSDNPRKSEVLDFSDNANQNQHCQDWSSLPEKTLGATGSYFLNKESALICGGSWAQDECYAIDDSSTSLITRMIDGRAYAASIVASNKYLWITGGIKDTGLATATTELINFELGISRQGSEMPIALASHDIVALSDSVFILTGGRSSDSYYSADTFAYLYDVDVWNKRFSFKEGRSDHISGIVTETSTFGQILVVAGGFNGASMDSVELLYFAGQDKEQWVSGKI